MIRFKTLVTAISVAAGALAAGAVAAADYPTRAITVLIGYAPGGSSDTIGRVVLEEMREALGQQITVVNLPGAAGSVAALKLLTAKPDGYTLMFGPAGIVATNPIWNANAAYELEQFTPLGAVSSLQAAFAAPIDRPYDDFSGFVAWAKENPGAKVATITPASKIQMEYVAEKEGLDLNFVPVKGGAGMISGLLGGEFDIAYSGGAHQKYPEQIKTLASASTSRLAALPDVATMDELGYISGYGSPMAMFGPAGLSDEIVSVLEDALLKAGRTDSAIKAMASLDFPPKEMTAAELAEEIVQGRDADQKLKDSVSGS